MNKEQEKLIQLLGDNPSDEYLTQKGEAWSEGYSYGFDSLEGAVSLVKGVFSLSGTNQEDGNVPKP